MGPAIDARSELDRGALTGALRDLRGRDGIRLRAEVLNDGERSTVVFFHGGGQTRQSWSCTGRAMAERGWTVYLVDLRGHGDSEWPAGGDYSMDAFAGDVAEVAGSLGCPVLVGASLGGLASMVAIGESPAPLASGLVLVDVAARIERRGAERVRAFMLSRMTEGYASVEEMAAAIAEYNPRRSRPGDVSGLRANVRQRPDGRWFWHWDPRFVTSTRGQLPPSSARLAAAAASLRLPVLVVRGALSDVLSPKGVDELATLVPGACAAVVPGAGHMVAGDRNDVFNEVVVDFLQGHVPAQRA